MKRREFLKSAATCAAFTTASTALCAVPKSSGRFFRGKVVDNRRPVAGVIVTDGLVCVRTDAKGEFAIPERKGARFIYVTVPSGFQCADFYYPASPATKSYIFRLSPWKPSARKGPSSARAAC